MTGSLLRPLGIALLLCGCAGNIADPMELGGNFASPDHGGGVGSGAGGGVGSGAGGRSTTSGGAGVGGGSSSPGAEPAFACDMSRVGETVPARRLTLVQLNKTLSDFAAFALGDPTMARAVMSEISPATTLMPAERQSSNPLEEGARYRRMDQDLDTLQAETLIAIGQSLGRALTTPARLGRVAGACAVATDGSDAASCVDAFIKRVGSRALRRPLFADEVTFYKQVYGDARQHIPEAFADVIAVLVNSPQFYYIVEHADQSAPNRPGAYLLTSFELASRLSYHFWQTMPDQELWRAAEAGELAAEEGYRRQVERLFIDTRTQATIDEFVRDWLELDQMALLESSRLSDPVYRAFTGTLAPTTGLRGAMINDVLDLFRYFIWTKPTASLNDVLTSELSFARADDLARVMEAPKWSGTGEPPAMPPGVRPGLLLRPALLANLGNLATRPIMKGVEMRKQLLCDDLPSPPDNAAADAKLPTGPMTTRQQVEAITEANGTACAGCHKTFLNPLGFATENFDAYGRRRTEERLFDKTGKEVAVLTVNTKAIPQVVFGDMTPVDGPAGLVQQVVKSGKVKACIARNYFRFSFGRFEDLNVDGCTLSRLTKALAQGGSLSGMLKEAAFDPAFRQRTF